jgi:hypothetical protein
MTTLTTTILMTIDALLLTFPSNSWGNLFWNFTAVPSEKSLWIKTLVHCDVESLDILKVLFSPEKNKTHKTGFWIIINFKLI